MSNSQHRYHRPSLTPPRVEEDEPAKVAVFLGGLLSIALTAVFVAFLVWASLGIAGVSDLLTLKQLFGIGFGYVTIRSVDLLMVKSIKA